MSVFNKDLLRIEQLRFLDWLEVTTPQIVWSTIDHQFEEFVETEFDQTTLDVVNNVYSMEQIVESPK